MVTKHPLPQGVFSCARYFVSPFCCVPRPCWHKGTFHRRCTVDTSPPTKFLRSSLTKLQIRRITLDPSPTGIQRRFDRITAVERRTGTIRAIPTVFALIIRADTGAMTVSGTRRRCVLITQVVGATPIRMVGLLGLGRIIRVGGGLAIKHFSHGPTTVYREHRSTKRFAIKEENGEFQSCHADGQP